MQRSSGLPLPFMAFIANFTGLWFIFLIYHGVFFFRHYPATLSFSWGELLYGGWLMVKFDLHTLAYLFLPVMIVMIISLVWLNFQGVFLWLNRGYGRLVYFLIVFLLVIDVEYYTFLNTHLDEYFFAYRNPGELWPILGTIHHIYPLYWVIPALLVFMFWVFKLQTWWFRWMERKISSRNQKYRYNVLILILVLPVYFLFLRGSTGIYALNWGEAFYSQNYFLNQNVLNGGYSLMRALYQDYQDWQRDVSLDRLTFVPIDSALQETRRMVMMPYEEWMPHSGYPLARRILPDTARPQTRYNLVFIIMESFSSRFNGKMGSPEKASPCFDSLAEQGIVFDRFYATGFRTNSAISSLLSSFPPVLGTSVLKQMQGKSIPSIAKILKPFDYRSVFIYGGDANFDNMKGYLISTGFEECLDQDVIVSRFRTKWGVPDEDVFAAAHRKFVSYGDHPFVGAILTISNHEPFQLPPWVKPFYPANQPMSEYLNTYRYSDQALGQFFLQAKTAGYYSKTIFFICADHGRNYQSEAYYDINRFHIPACMVAPGILPENLKTIRTITSQIDVIPMMLYCLNLPVTHSCWGRNPLLENSPEGWAIWTRNPTIGSRMGSIYSIDELDGPAVMYRVDSREQMGVTVTNPDSVRYYQTRGRVFMESAVYCFKNRLSQY